MTLTPDIEDALSALAAHPSAEVLADHLNGELPPASTRLLAAHLSVCAACQRRADSLAKALAKEDDDPAILERISGIADARRAAHAAQGGSAPRPAPPPRLVTARAPAIMTLKAAAAENARLPVVSAELRVGESIAIGGTDLRFRYTPRPLKVFLEGPLPAGVAAFEAGGVAWPLKRTNAPDLHEVPGLQLWQIDGFGGAGRWIRRDD